MRLSLNIYICKHLQKKLFHTIFCIQELFNYYLLIQNFMRKIYISRIEVNPLTVSFSEGYQQSRLICPDTHTNIWQQH